MPRDRVDDLEMPIFLRERGELVVANDFVGRLAAVHERDRRREFRIGRVFDHALERSDADATRDHDRGMRPFKKKPPVRPFDLNRIAAFEQSERALPFTVQHAHDPFEMIARGR